MNVRTRVQAESDDDSFQSLANKFFEVGEIRQLESTLAKGVFLADIENDIARFRLELSYARDDMGVPCVIPESGGLPPTPVDTNDIFSNLHFPLEERSRIDIFRLLGSLTLIPELFSKPLLRTRTRIVDQLMDEMNLKTERFSPSEAIGFFTYRLGLFLERRITSSSNDEFSLDISTSSNPPPNMLHFQVHSQNPGLRIYYTPAYLQKQTVFNSPSTPVSQWLPPGRYKFGGESRTIPFKWDPGEYDIPPSQQAILVAV